MENRILSFIQDAAYLELCKSQTWLIMKQKVFANRKENEKKKMGKIPKTLKKLVTRTRIVT